MSEQNIPCAFLLPKSEFEAERFDGYNWFNEKVVVMGETIGDTRRTKSVFWADKVCFFTGVNFVYTDISV